MSKYHVFVEPSAWKEINHLPGNMRQRLKRAVDDLSLEPRPARTKLLEADPPTLELRRLRLANWRVIYAVNEELKQVQVLAIRQRPPYDYDDLAQLLDQLD
jgi:mRNA-degrading endonuclease RelE of RelBE toxin-antitoxin system